MDSGGRRPLLQTLALQRRTKFTGSLLGEPGGAAAGSPWREQEAPLVPPQGVPGRGLGSEHWKGPHTLGYGV